jgi:hypothetical protein
MFTTSYVENLESGDQFGDCVNPDGRTILKYKPFLKRLDVDLI